MHACLCTILSVSMIPQRYKGSNNLKLKQMKYMKIGQKSSHWALSNQIGNFSFTTSKSV